MDRRSFIKCLGLTPLLAVVPKLFAKDVEWRHVSTITKQIDSSWNGAAHLSQESLDKAVVDMQRFTDRKQDEIIHYNPDYLTDPDKWLINSKDLNKEFMAMLVRK